MDNLEFLHETEDASGESISICYQCYKCSNGCPVAGEMDVLPHRIIRHVIQGNKEKVLKSKSIWTCLQCMTCSTRCPNDIDVARVIGTLRKMSAIAGLEAEKDTWLFDNLFLDSVQRHGRLYELEAIMKYKMAKRDFFSDTNMGIRIFLKGRMGMFPHNIKDRKRLKGMFKKTESKKVKNER